jgi:hypothetical protein
MVASSCPSPGGKHGGKKTDVLNRVDGAVSPRLHRTAKIAVPSLTVTVAGPVAGAGICNVPRGFATAIGPFGALVAWAIAGAAMYALARVFQFPADRRLDIDSGAHSSPSLGISS